jgi:hypothetical protein
MADDLGDMFRRAAEAAEKAREENARNPPRQPGPRRRRGRDDEPEWLSGKEFILKYRPTIDLVDGLMSSASVCALTGITNHGKTAFLILLTLAIVTNNHKLLGKAVRPGRVAYCTAENPIGFQMRLAVAVHYANIDLELLDYQLVVLDKRIHPEEIHEYLKCTELDYDLIVIDTWQAFFDGKDVNNPTEAANFARRLRPLTSLPGNPTVIFAAHPNKNAAAVEELVPSGGGSILNEIDANLTIFRQDSGDFELHWMRKIRGADFDPLGFRIEQKTSPDIANGHGVEIAVPVMRRIVTAEAEKREQTTEERKMAVLRTVRDYPRSSVRELTIKAGVPRSTLHRIFKALTKEKLIKDGLITQLGRKTLGNGAMGPEPEIDNPKVEGGFSFP